MKRAVALAVLTVAFSVAIGANALSPAAEQVPPSLRVITGPRPPIEISEPLRGSAAAPPIRHLLVRVERSIRLWSRPGGGRVVGVVPETSPYYGVPSRAWVLRVSPDGRFGRVPIPYLGRSETGWLPLRDLRTSTTRISVRADLSRHRLMVYRGDHLLFTAPAATGAPSTPTPAGRYVVSDRVAFPAGGVYGSFAFGISGIQTHLPPGWTGGNQLAIHGTNEPSSIGRSASYGCLRVSERVLDRLRPLLGLGTPVIFRP